jgi:hypothetical protein
MRFHGRSDAGDREGAAGQPALDDGDAEILQQCPFRLRLDTLGDDVEPEALAHRDGAPEDHLAGGIVWGARDEAAVDLELGEGLRPQQAER